MKKAFKIFSIVLVLSFFILPTLSFSQGLVPCKTDCDFVDLMDMVKEIINFILFEMAIPIAAIMFAYAGFLMVTSGGETSQKTKAKKIFTNVALGLIFAAAAWLIVHTVLQIAGYKEEWGTWLGL